MRSRADETHFRVLLDRVLDKRPLNREEEAQYARLRAAYPALRLEAAVLQALSDMEAQPTHRSHALAEAALAALAQPALQEERVSGSRPTRQRRRYRIGLAAGLVIVVLASATLAAWVWRTRNAIGPAAPMARAELVYASGDVRVGGSTPLSTVDLHGALLSTGQTIRTRAGRACVVLDPQIDVCLDEYSQVHLTRFGGRHRRLTLLQGKVGLKLARQPRSFDFTVVAGTVENTAVGTSFTVTKRPDAVHTTVLEGHVRVRTLDANGHRVQHAVGAHHRLAIEGHNAKRTTLARVQEAPEWAVIETAQLWKGRSSATLHVDGSPRGAEVWLDDWLVGRAPLTTLVPPGRQRVAVRLDRLHLLGQTVTFRAGERTTLKFVPPQAFPRTPGEPYEGPRPDAHRAPNRPVQTQARGPSAAALLSEARRLMVDRKYRKAASRYRTLRSMYPSSAEARTVLVALAQLALEHDRDPEAALHLLNEYLSGGPSALTQEARYLRIRTLEQLGFLRLEREAIEAFLAEYQHSFHTKRLKLRLAELRQVGRPAGSPRRP